LGKVRVILAYLLGASAVRLGAKEIAITFTHNRGRLTREQILIVVHSSKQAEKFEEVV
jgi:hypothetical protein